VKVTITVAIIMALVLGWIGGTFLEYNLELRSLQKTGKMEGFACTDYAERKAAADWPREKTLQAFGTPEPFPHMHAPVKVEAEPGQTIAVYTEDRQPVPVSNTVITKPGRYWISSFDREHASIRRIEVLAPFEKMNNLIPNKGRRDQTMTFF
jgi:hypothetical protein